MLSPAHLVQNPGEIRNGHPVVGHGHPLFLGLGEPGEHIGPVEHTPAAVNDQIIPCQVPGKVAPRHHVHAQALPRSLPQQSGDLHPPNVLLQGGVGAGFRDEHPAVFGKGPNGLGPLGEGVNVPFLRRLED